MNLFIVLSPATLMVPTAIGITPETNVVSTQPVVSAKTEVAAPQDSTSTDAPGREATEAAASTKEVPVVSTTAPVTQSETPVEKTTLTDTTQSTEAGTEETATPEATTDIKNQGEGSVNDGETQPNVEVEEQGSIYSILTDIQRK